VGADEIYASCKLMNYIIDDDYNLLEHLHVDEVYSMSFYLTSGKYFTEV
jgi:hypothetical protein